MASKKIRLLIAEDERPVAKALQLKLSHSGFDVTVAENGEVALDEIKKEKFQIIILDLMMPKVDGFGVLQALKEVGDTTPVIVASNLSQKEDIDRAQSLGAKDYYVKSDTPIAAIVEKIQTAVKS